MKKVLAALLSALLLFGALAGCTNGNFRFEGEASVDNECVTRGEWIDMLAETFGMDSFENSTPYFSDIPFGDTIFGSVQSSCEWSVLRDVSSEFKKNEKATLEFVVSTAIYATDADIANCEGSSDIDKAIDYAENHGVVSQGLKYSDFVSAKQCEDILTAAQKEYLNREIVSVSNVVISEDVADYRENTAIVCIEDNKYVFENSQPSVGDIYIAPGTPESPEGVAVKITEVTENEDGTYTVTTETPELYEVFDEIEYQGVVAPKFEDIVPAEGVTLTEITSGNVSPVLYVPNDSGTKVTNLSNKSKQSSKTQQSENNIVPLTTHTYKSDSLSFTATCNFVNGTVTTTSDWLNELYGLDESVADSNAGAVFKKTATFPDKVLFGSDPYSNDEAIEAYGKGLITAEELRQILQGDQKSDEEFVYNPGNKYVTSQEGHEYIPTITEEFSGGYNITGTLTIRDLYFSVSCGLKNLKLWGIDTGVPIGVDNLSIETNYVVESSLVLEGRLENDLRVADVIVPIEGLGTLNVSFYLHAELNGEISVYSSVTNNSKLEYASGKFKKTCQKSATATTDINASLETGVGVNAMLSVCGIPIIDAGFSADLQIDTAVNCKLVTEWIETDDSFIIERKTSFYANTDLYVPIVKISCGADKSTLANKMKISGSWTMVDREGKGAPFSALKINLMNEDVVIWEESLTLPKNDEADSESEEDSDSGKTQDGSDTDPNNGVAADSMTKSLSISAYLIRLNVGDSGTVNIKYPDGYGADDFEWESSDTSVATVSGGEIKANSSGSAIITVKSKDGKYAADCAVYVDADETVEFEELGSGGTGGGRF